MIFEVDKEHGSVRMPPVTTTTTTTTEKPASFEDDKELVSDETSKIIDHGMEGKPISVSLFIHGNSSVRGIVG